MSVSAHFNFYLHAIGCNDLVYFKCLIWFFSWLYRWGLFLPVPISKITGCVWWICCKTLQFLLVTTAFWLATFLPSKRTYQRLLVSFNASLICLPFLPWSWKWKMGPSNSKSIVDDYSYLLNTAIFHFHNLGECVIGFGSRKCHWNVIKFWQLCRTICQRELDSANLLCHMRSQLSPCGDKRTTKNTICREKCREPVQATFCMSWSFPQGTPTAVIGPSLACYFSILCPFGQPGVLDDRIHQYWWRKRALESKSVDHIQYEYMQ